MKLNLHPNLLRERLFSGLCKHSALENATIAQIEDLIDKIVWQLRFIEMEESVGAVLPKAGETDEY